MQSMWSLVWKNWFLKDRLYTDFKILFFLHIPMRKILLVAILLLSSLTHVMAADIDPIAQTKALLDQYSTRVKYLETENTILREEMRKAGIKIPLALFSGAIQTESPTVNSSNPQLPSTVVATGTTNTGKVMSTITASGEVSFANIEKIYGTQYTGFIRRLISEWDKVRDAYAMPKNAYIAGYEFVQSGALDHVFVDINYTGSGTASGSYDAKILYQFDKTTFARKLIGFFQYNTTTWYFVTKTGNNIFPGVKRTWVADPRVVWVTLPITVSSSPTTLTNSGTIATTPVVTTSSSVKYVDIEVAYAAKRYLSVISLSNSWLTANTPNIDILRLRYRTYFIIGKYPEALAEIERIRTIGQLSSAVACEWYVIATYAKNVTLSDSYKAICNKK